MCRYFGLFLVFLIFALAESVYSSTPVEKEQIEKIQTCHEKECGTICSDPRYDSECGACVIKKCSPQT